MSYVRMIRRARRVDGEWYLPVGDFHEMRRIAADALRLLGDNEWTPEQLDALHRRYSEATGGERP